MKTRFKFRVWDKLEKKFLTHSVFFDPGGDLYIDTGVHTYQLSLDKTDRYEIDWSTGLKDKNGVEIYDGDIIFDGNNHGVIIWIGCGWACDFGKELGLTDISNVDEWGTIVGNIHQNPELLS